MRRSIISTAVLGSLASVMLLYAAGPADAMPRSCGQKYLDCTDRCMRRSDKPGDSSACITRTCIHQENNCRTDAGGKVTGKGGPKAGGKGGGADVRDHRAGR